MDKFNFKATFPVIKSTIRELNLTHEWADRDAIVQKILLNGSLNHCISKVEDQNLDFEWRVGNIVDWFSAHFTRKTGFMKEYLSEFEREKFEIESNKGKKRKIWAYKVLTTRITEEVDATELNKFSEGSITKIFVNKYERNLSARKACISHHGLDCKVCGFNFKDHYGNIGENFIHVHHLKEISKVGKDYIVNPITDLVPVCANCHAMIHKNDPPLTIEELKSKIRN